MKTGRIPSISNQEHGFISGLIGLFLEEVFYDCVIYIGHLNNYDESQSDESSESDSIEDGEVVDSDEPIDTDQVDEDAEPSEGGSSEDSGPHGIPPELLRAAALREIDSPDGILSDVEIMYNVQFRGHPVDEQKSNDQVYRDRVKRVFNYQKEFFKNGKIDSQGLTSLMLVLATKRALTCVPENEPCSLCQDLERYAEENVQLKDNKSPLAELLLKAMDSVGVN